jgi:hypothetical protein
MILGFCLRWLQCSRLQDAGVALLLATSTIAAACAQDQAAPGPAAPSTPRLVGYLSAPKGVNLADSIKTRDLIALTDWLRQCNIRSVAMESTGVYWIPLYQILETHGFEVFLVNAHHEKNVPGSKSDVSDCQWIQYLRSVGLLKAGLRPPDEICVLRSLAGPGWIVAKAGPYQKWCNSRWTELGGI